MKHTLFLAIALSAVLTLAGCGSATTAEPMQEPVMEATSAPAADAPAGGIYFPQAADAQAETYTAADGTTQQSNETQAIYSTAMSQADVIAFIRSEYEAAGYTNSEAIPGDADVIWNVNFPAAEQTMIDTYRFLDVFVANTDSNGRTLIRIGVTTYTP